jgi:hypothetical protein
MVAPVMKFSEPKRLSDLLVYEAELGYSRDDDGTVKSTTVTEIGTVLARDEDGKIVPLAGDGSLAAVDVALVPRAATATDTTDTLVRIARHAILKDSGLAWPAGISAANKAKAIGDLKSAGILVRRAV